MTNGDAKAEDWLRIVRSEYVEMPSLRLTAPQARRLWGLDDAQCSAVLNALVSEDFLRVTPDGRYTRSASYDPPSDYWRRTAPVGAARVGG